MQIHPSYPLLLFLLLLQPLYAQQPLMLEPIQGDSVNITPNGTRVVSLNLKTVPPAQPSPTPPPVSPSPLPTAAPPKQQAIEIKNTTTTIVQNNTSIHTAPIIQTRTILIRQRRHCTPPDTTPQSPPRKATPNPATIKPDLYWLNRQTLISHSQAY